MQISVPVMHSEKMAVTDTLFHQHAVVEFLVIEGNLAGVIYSVYGDSCMGASSVRRCQCLNKEDEDSTLGHKVMGTVSWGSEGCKLVNFLENKEMINAAHYSQTLNKLHRALHEKSPKKKTVILQHDNARPQDSAMLAEMHRSGWRFCREVIRCLDFTDIICFCMYTISL
jgi:hypothetical protein